MGLLQPRQIAAHGLFEDVDLIQEDLVVESPSDLRQTLQLGPDEFVSFPMP